MPNGLRCGYTYLGGGRIERTMIFGNMMTAKAIRESYPRNVLWDDVCQIFLRSRSRTGNEPDWRNYCCSSVKEKHEWEVHQAWEYDTGCLSFVDSGNGGGIIRAYLVYWIDSLGVFEGPVTGWSAGDANYMGIENESWRSAYNEQHKTNYTVKGNSDELQRKA